MFWGAKTPQNSVKFFGGLRHMYRKYILEKNWSKTTIPALSSGQTENDTPIWGRRHQLDDQNRNPNMNNRDHLVGRPTSGAPQCSRRQTVGPNQHRHRRLFIAPAKVGSSQLGPGDRHRHLHAFCHCDFNWTWICHLTTDRNC